MGSPAFLTLLLFCFLPTPNPLPAGKGVLPLRSPAFMSSSISTIINFAYAELHSYAFLLPVF